MVELKESSDFKFTLEQKLVTAVWVHEKLFADLSFKDIQKNFELRFGLPAPSAKMLRRWEYKLFNHGNVDYKVKRRSRSGRPSARLMHVPYVQASLDESPELSLRDRSKLLGIPSSTLVHILREDMDMVYEPETKGPRSDTQSRNSCYNGGKWKKKSECLGSS